MRRRRLGLPGRLCRGSSPYEAVHKGGPSERWAKGNTVTDLAFFSRAPGSAVSITA